MPRRRTGKARSIARFITGRRSKYVVVLLVLLVAGGLASQAGNVTFTSDPAVLLPDGAESVRALQAIERFPSGDVTAAVVVATRGGGLTAADRERLGRLRDEVAGEELPGAGRPSPPQVSEDGAAAVFVVPFSGVDEDELVGAVGRLRDLGAELEQGGLEIYLTGGAGFAADVSDVFGGINGVLLIGAATIVLVLLVLIYRSPVFWLIPFFTVLLAEGASRGTQYLLGEAGFSITGQAAGIASVVTFGAATDYALLLVARYREELKQHEDTHVAMRNALRGAAPAILASGMTVVLGLLTLLLARVGSSQALGPLAAAGVFLAMTFSLTLLPATLLVAGRRAFWPRIPRAGASVDDPREGWWWRLGDRVRRRPRAVWLGAVAVLILLALGLTRIDLGLAENEQFARDVEAVEGAEVLARVGFEQGGGAPLQIVVPDAGRADAVADAVRRLEEVARVLEPERGEPGALVGVVPRADPFGTRALAAVPEVRRAAREAAPAALVGGPLAEDYDTREAAERDNLVVVPSALAVVLLILFALLRAAVLPVLLIATVVLSFASAFGVGVLASDLVFGFAGIETTLPLIAFVFLVALGVDYNIFLVARAREESGRHGTAEGMHRALASTGSVITSAGIVLPALVWDGGPRVWWPQALDR